MEVSSVGPQVWMDKGLTDSAVCGVTKAFADLSGDPAEQTGKTSCSCEP